jgi:hypothetical protein
VAVERRSLSVEPVRVHALSVADAECVAEALTVLRADVRIEEGATVSVTPLGDRDRALVDILDVLQVCLGENGVDAVRVDVAGATYALRRPAAAPAGGA